MVSSVISVINEGSLSERHSTVTPIGIHEIYPVCANKLNSLPEKEEKE
jgi:hypothetical protein